MKVENKLRKGGYTRNERNKTWDLRELLELLIQNKKLYFYYSLIYKLKVFLS